MSAPASTAAVVPKRFYSLDVLRGLAALSVVLWHWQHFFLPANPNGSPFEMARQPLYGLLSMFYQHGAAAVQLFFCLSGFIFFWLYSRPVGERAISFGSFSILRLSRLYPLHLLTLLLVAAGQLAFVAAAGKPFVFAFNDRFHFVLHLLFVPVSLFEGQPAFNQPVWSVSVELIVYVVFFVFCRVFRRVGPLSVAAMFVLAAAGFGLRALFNDIGQGVMGFFLGGVVFATYSHLVRPGASRALSVLVPVAAAFAWGAAFWLTRPGSEASVPMGGLLGKLLSSADVLVLFPLTILALALLETRRGTLGRRLAFIGDVSYSSYLLHFPLQLAVALASMRLAAPAAGFESPWFLLAFFAALLAVAGASHRWFELPCQRALRRYAGWSRPA
ncbi:MAG: acyltransferase [Candidatus Eisenbacteria bacterium]